MLDQENPKPLSVAIIGAGIGGLVCAIACRRQGLQVTVLEQAHEIKTVGAGIQMPPNACRVLESLGVLHLVEQEGQANNVKHLRLLRYKDGEILAKRPVGRNGMPWFVIHRADYHRVLLQEAERLGTKVVLNSKVVGLDVQNGIITSEDRREVTADVIVGGDGLWSVTRSLVLDHLSEPSETGDLAYRATFSREELLELNDPRVTELCQVRDVSVWVGPEKHCVFYPLHDGKQFNLVLIRPDNMPAGERTLSGDIEEMRETFEGWDELLTKIISRISSVLKWKLMHHSELERWVNGCVALIGDSCHPTLPYQAQGAAMAVEDGGIIGNLIGRLNRELVKGVIPQSRRHESINTVLGLYEQSQKHRTTVNVKGATSNGYFFHLPDGSEQEDRDKELAKHTFTNEKSGYMWADMPYNKQLLDADVLCDASDRLDVWLGKNY